MSLKLAAVVISALLLTRNADAGFYDGQFLKRLCDQEMAMPYVLGAYDAYEIAGASGSLLKICLPDGMLGKEVTAIVCKYVREQSSDDLISSAGVVVAAALRAVHSCPGTYFPQ